MSDPAPLPRRTDLDDTRRCPLGIRCESCGDDHDDLVVATATTPIGVICLTLCPRCATPPVTPTVSVGTAARFVLQHCEHLKIDPDEMAGQLAAEQEAGQ